MSRMLTAEQVMAIAGRHQPDYCSDTHVCFDWQAIADELNATLVKQGYYTDRDDEGTHIMCDRCGEYIGTAEAIAATLGGEERTCHDVSENPLRFECSRCGMLSLEIAPWFCPGCGAKVVDE